MLYDYEIKFSDGSSVKNVYPLKEKVAYEAMGRYIEQHFIYRSGEDVKIIYARVSISKKS